MLSARKIEFLLVGGYAVSYYGYPRPTGDLDIWIAANSENAQRILAALDEFGFGDLGATEDLLLKSGVITRMGYPPVRIEIMNAISGRDFSDCYSRRVEAVVDGVPVPMISREDLIANKAAAARQKDLNDIKHLLKKK